MPKQVSMTVTLDFEIPDGADVDLFAMHLGQIIQNSCTDSAEFLYTRVENVSVMEDA